MKLLAERDTLLSAFQLVNSAVAARDIKPILRNVKAIADDDHCTLLATDLEVGIRPTLLATPAEEPGEALLPAQRMLAILREVPDQQLTLETDADTSRIRGQTNEFEMPGDDPAHFPDVPAFNGTAFHELSAGTLREMIRRTSFAAAMDSPRYAMNGTLWELEGHSVRLVATDGRRLAVTEAAGTPHGDHTTKGSPHIVPTKTMQLLERHLYDPEEPIKVGFQPNEVHFQTRQATITSRLVEGRYPAWREVIPKQTTAKVPLTAGPLLTALRQAAIMADDDSRKIALDFAPRKLRLQARGAETGRSQVELAIDYDGKPLAIAFDAKLVIDMLRVLPPDTTLTLAMTDDKKPAVFKIGDHYSYVVMPLG